jgi:hypothetical protein
MRIVRKMNAKSTVSMEERREKNPSFPTGKARELKKNAVSFLDAGMENDAFGIAWVSDHAKM